jgi:hypothetical protein
MRAVAHPEKDFMTVRKGLPPLILKISDQVFRHFGA